MGATFEGTKTNRFFSLNNDLRLENVRCASRYFTTLYANNKLFFFETKLVKFIKFQFKLL